ncbi:MAG: hypothetical protein AB7V36_09670 [Bacteroidales bacterium]
MAAIPFINTQMPAQESQSLFPKYEIVNTTTSIQVKLEDECHDFFNILNRCNEKLIDKIVEDYVNSLVLKLESDVNFQSSAYNNVFIIVAAELLKLNPKFLGVEISNSNSIFFNAKFLDLTAHFEAFIDFDSNTFDIVLNAYKGSEHVLSILGNLAESIENIKSFMPSDSAILLERLSIENYELSCDPTSTAVL